MEFQIENDLHCFIVLYNIVLEKFDAILILDPLYVRGQPVSHLEVIRIYFLSWVV